METLEGGLDECVQLGHPERDLQGAAESTVRRVAAQLAICAELNHQRRGP